MSDTRAQYGERLREIADRMQGNKPLGVYAPYTLQLAADEIIRLRAENERLRVALRPFAREADDWEESTDDDFYPAIGESGDGAWSTAPATFTVGDLRRARAVLNHAAPAAEQEGE